MEIIFISHQRNIIFQTYTEDNKNSYNYYIGLYLDELMYHWSINYNELSQEIISKKTKIQFRVLFK